MPTLAAPTSQLCTASQFLEPAYAQWCAELGQPVRFHRKQWEFVFILQALATRGFLKPGMRGLGFGCGFEPLPDLLEDMGCAVTATDLDPKESQARGWPGSDALSAVDMNAIPAELVDFDFLWSSCAFEHLGSIAHGLAFVERAMTCLRPGGIAVHTTEYNLTSTTDTWEASNLVLFRKTDIDTLFARLTAAGHHVAPLDLDSGSEPLDLAIAEPPYAADHLKLRIGAYVSTSLGLIIAAAPGQQERPVGA